MKLHPSYLAKLTLFGSLLTCAAAAQAYWPNFLNGPTNNNDAAIAIDVSPNGDVMVAGNTNGNGTGTDILLVDYDRYGNQKWIATYGSANLNDSTVAGAMDADGNVYVTGITTQNGTEDWVTLKYSSAGALLWSKIYDGPAGLSDHPVTMGVDDAGNVDVSGFVQAGGANIDIATVQYDASGHKNWARTYSSKGSHVDIPRDIAIDTNGDIFLAARIYGDGYDFGALKYSSTGDRMWVSRLNGSPGGSDSAVAVVLDADGNAIVTGKSVSGIGSTDFLTVKYDTNGAKIWQSRYGKSNLDETASDVKVDAAGNVYVVGTAVDTSVSDLSDAVLVKYDANGVKQWNKTFTGHTDPQNSLDSGIGVEVTNDGSIYMGVSAETNTASPQFYFVMTKFDSTGHRAWVRYDSIGSVGNSIPHAMAKDVNRDRVYMTGTSLNSASGTDDFYTTKY